VFGDEIDAGTIQVAQPEPEEAEPEEEESPPASPADKEPPVEHDVRKLRAALDTLSARRRAVVTRFYFRNEETKAIAREMKISAALARKDLERGRRDLRRAMTTPSAPRKPPVPRVEAKTGGRNSK
jgi:DNA-directed RNA polymerase specialized sigma24 family protein